jgi:protocatechuate 3,4-dioxygenase beta subunit
MTILISTTANGQVPCLTGYVTDESGAPVADADLDFDQALTGRRMYTPDDNTDPTGFYRVCLIPGIYHISFAPPLRSHLLGKRYFSFDLTQSQNLNVTLNSGVVMQGTALDSLGLPVAAIDFDIDTLGGGRVYTPNDNSDSIGAFWLVSPPGLYRLRLSPPRGSRMRGLEIDSVALAADTAVDFVVPAGWLLGGRVTDEGGLGLLDIPIDFREHATGQKIFVSNNSTDSAGVYIAAVPGGTFNVRYTPPYGSRLIAEQIDSVVVNSDMNRNQTMRAGILVNCLVTDSSGVPIANANFDFTDETSGRREFTPYDLTRADGTTIVSLAPDTFTIRIDPPPGSFFDRQTLTGIPLLNDTSMTFILPEVQRVTFGGRVIDRQGRGLPDILIDLRSSITGQSVSLSDNRTDSIGSFSIAVPMGLFDVSFSPARGSRFVGARMTEVEFAVDTTWDEVALDTGVIFSVLVLDPEGAPVIDVDFDFSAESGEQPIYTPNDNTGADGTADITVPAGVYTIGSIPPAGSDLQPRVLGDVNVRHDTSITLFLTRSGEVLPAGFLLRQNYPNPFNEMTLIGYTLLRGSTTTIYIYNAIGQRVRVMEGGFQDAGYHTAAWDGKDDNGGPVASGLYFYQLKTSSGNETREMLFIK